MKLNDIIDLDEHRLMCADSQIKENVDKLLDGEKVGLLLTDPPYGINIVNVGGGKLVDKEVQQLDHLRTNTHTHTHTKWHNWRSETSKLQDKELWEHQQDQASRERERERESIGKVGKPRHC